MSFQPVLKRSLHWAGSAVALVGIVFVVIRLRDYGAQIDFTRFNSAEWLAVGGCALIYGLANLMLASAWRNLLCQLGASPSRSWAIRIYGISQLAKYVPGNIFHLAGRQAMGMAAGVPGWPLAKSSVWELGLISFSGGLFSFLALPLLSNAFPGILAVVFFGGGVGIALLFLRRFIGSSGSQAFAWYVGFLTVTGLLFVGLIALVSEDFDGGILLGALLCGAYVVAWLAGLVTPGAPAGVGVRELVLLLLLKGVVADSDLILAVLLGRVVTVGGIWRFLLWPH